MQHAKSAFHYSQLYGGRLYKTTAGVNGGTIDQLQNLMSE